MCTIRVVEMDRKIDENVNTVKTKLYRALKKLKLQLKGGISRNE